MALISSLKIPAVVFAGILAIEGPVLNYALDGNIRNENVQRLSYSDVTGFYSSSVVHIHKGEQGRIEVDFKTLVPWVGNYYFIDQNKDGKVDVIYLNKNSEYNPSNLPLNFSRRVDFESQKELFETADNALMAQIKKYNLEHHLEK